MASIAKSATIPQEFAKAEEPVRKAPEDQRPRRKPRPTIKTLTPSAMITKLKVGSQGLALVMDHFGSDKPESFTEMDIIYINRDHPLYVREAHHRERHIMHVARLIGQEIALMSHPRHPREAFERQSKLLRDAFVSEPQHEKP